MKKVNFNAIEEHVRTQYGDLTGVIQLDGHDNISSIYALCKDHKFDTSDKSIIGFGITESTISGIGRSGEVSCAIFYVNKKEYGNNFEEIDKKIIDDGLLRLKQKNIYIEYSSLGKYIKRFDFIAMTSLAKNAKTIEIDEEDRNE